jgi:hydrogenase nickel incorporation protein HypB
MLNNSRFTHLCPPSASLPAVSCRRGILPRSSWSHLLSSPGAGKTRPLERMIRDPSGEMRLFVIEGDQASANDADRIRAAGAPVVQVNTGTGCHLDADMVARGLAQ